MNSNIFDLLTFHLLPASDKKFNLSDIFMYD